MAHAKQASKRKRRRTTLPALGAAGVSLAMTGGASAAVAPQADVLAQDVAPRPVITLGEEEISDVRLGTFYVFDKENADAPLVGLQYARHGCGGCGGCGCRGCGRCGRGCGCAILRGCGGCGGCAACGGCGPCWQWTPLGWIPVC
jgi:hypothetical protein